MNPVDDALMRITHVLRGEDLLPSTPRQIALYQALIEIGVAETRPAVRPPANVMGEGNKKLSKRDPQSNLFAHRDRGFIPEGLLNYLALLGWSIADDHDIFTLDEMVAAFDVADVNANPARFDQKKADAINAEHIRHAGLPTTSPRDCETSSTPTAATPGWTTPASPWPPHLVQTRIVVLGDAWDLLKFLSDDEYAIDPKAAAKELGPDAGAVLDAALQALDGVQEWTTERIEAALKAALIEGLALKPRKAFGPIRVAATGTTVSPPLFESLELLGRDRSLRRAAGRPRTRSPSRRAGIGVRVFGSLHVGRQRPAAATSNGITQSAECALTSGFRQPMGYGVIGNTADSGSAILGSSPGTPARSRLLEAMSAIRWAYRCELC